jgi:hypothetical protein
LDYIRGTAAENVIRKPLARLTNKKITEWASQLLLLLRRSGTQSVRSGRGRSRLCILEAPRSLPHAERSDQLHYPPTAGGRPLRTGSATTFPSDREAAPQGRALAQSRDPEGGFETQLLLCTELDTAPQKVLCWFVMRWQLEVTF